MMMKQDRVSVYALLRSVHIETAQHDSLMRTLSSRSVLISTARTRPKFNIQLDNNAVPVIAEIFLNNKDITGKQLLTSEDPPSLLLWSLQDQYGIYSTWWRLTVIAIGISGVLCLFVAMLLFVMWFHRQLMRKQQKERVFNFHSFEELTQCSYQNEEYSQHARTLYADKFLNRQLTCQYTNDSIYDNSVTRHIAQPTACNLSDVPLIGSDCISKLPSPTLTPLSHPLPQPSPQQQQPAPSPQPPPPPLPLFDSSLTNSFGTTLLLMDTSQQCYNKQQRTPLPLTPIQIESLQVLRYPALPTTLVCARNANSTDVPGVTTAVTGLKSTNENVLSHNDNINNDNNSNNDNHNNDNDNNLVNDQLSVYSNHQYVRSVLNKGIPYFQGLSFPSPPSSNVATQFPPFSAPNFQPEGIKSDNKYVNK